MKSLLCAFVLAAAMSSTSGQTQGPPLTASSSAAPAERKPWELEWAYWSRYREANAALGLPAAGEVRVIFMGDSITEGWEKHDPEFFRRTGYIDRGIGGQNTSQMLVRFRQDVIMLKP